MHTYLATLQKTLPGLSSLFQMGENDWHILTEKEQMKKLMEMKLKERKLRHEKKYDELAALLGKSLSFILLLQAHIWFSLMCHLSFGHNTKIESQNSIYTLITRSL